MCQKCVAAFVRHGFTGLGALPREALQLKYLQVLLSAMLATEGPDEAQLLLRLVARDLAVVPAEQITAAVMSLRRAAEDAEHTEAPQTWNVPGPERPQ